MSGETTLYDRFGSTFDAGALIFREGDVGDEMYIIQKGKVRISKRIANKEHTLAILEKGDFFGEMAIVTRSARTATATALDEVAVLAFTRDGFLSMITKNAKIAINIIDKLCQRLQGANAQIQRLVRRNARALVALSLHYGYQAVGWARGELPYDRTVGEIAVNLEMPAEIVKEHLEALQADGAIQLQGNTMVLADRAKLEAAAEVQAGRAAGAAG
jgi:CRP/FNR family transcriptional regulator, cyclic AMP receptor protein